MLRQELLGRHITSVAVSYECLNGWLDQATCYLRLDNDLLVGLPWAGAQPDTPLAVPALPHNARQLRPAAIRPLLLQPIVGVISYEPEEILLSSDLLELTNGYLLGEVSVSPSGTGDAGLWQFASITEVEARFGPGYRRLPQVR